MPGGLVKGDKVINLINTEILPANKPKNMVKNRSIPVANGEIGIIGQLKALKDYKLRFFWRGVFFATSEMFLL